VSGTLGVQPGVKHTVKSIFVTTQHSLINVVPQKSEISEFVRFGM